MASKSKNAHSVVVVKEKRTMKDGSIREFIVCYLSQRDVDNGLDIQYDLMGYTIYAI